MLNEIRDNNQYIKVYKYIFFQETEQKKSQKIRLGP